MTRGLVVDASVALAIVRREPGSDAAAAALREADELVVPELFWLEIVNVLLRRHGLQPELVVEAIRDLDELDLATVQLDRPTLLLALDQAARSGLTAYDAVYLALAEAADLDLLTLDAALAAAAGPRAVALDVGAHRASEAPAPYTTSAVDWRRFGPYLARLRTSTGARS
jgi:predicted nucleic acid-binding protein